MVPAFDHPEKPSIVARRAALPGTGRIKDLADWERVPPVALRGFNGTPAQRTDVRALWSEDWFFFVFDCADNAIVSPGPTDGLAHFMLGDTAEIFIARRGEKKYVEIHGTPAGRKTVYFFTDYRKPSDPPPSSEKIQVFASRPLHGWSILFAVPRDLLGPVTENGEHEVFFGRYDYAAEGIRPCLSSYPAQPGDKPDFHRRDNYAILRLKP